MKRFFISFLGALAGVWVSILLFGLLIFITIGVIAASSASEVDVPKVKKQSVLAITLSGEVVDRESPKNIINEIYGNDVRQIPLNTLVSSIKSAAEDDKIEGIFLDCKGLSAGLAQIEAIVNSLKEFSKSGKWIMAYGDSYSQSDYIIASTADSLFVNPVGVIDVHGLTSTTLYFKNLLEKAGVDVQVVKVGTFKSAVEPFILNDMSEANRLQTSEFLSNIWDHLRNTLAQGRNVTDENITEWADCFTYTKDTEFYVKNKLADATLYRHQMDSLLARKSGLDDDEDKPNLIEFDKYALTKKDENKSLKNKKQIAVLYAAGDITEDGDGGIASERMVPQILDLADDDDVDALVLRVNSGGGSAYASEQIWEALQQFKSRTGKPFYVSMGDYAASGGYYISCGADKIFAEPVTLTGSIGIFGLIPNAEKLLSDKIGINTVTV
ncbi:MAG: signal peptide peptidase SppA, partial [Paramuribaculum sp.]|nr:signal peptide peptidase SppA [Paramuribaculum sp.]